MAISPIALKGLIAVGSVSLVSVGGIMLHQNGYLPWQSEKSLSNKEIFNPEDGSSSFRWEVITPTETIDKTKPITISLVGKKEQHIWTCNITRSIQNPSEQEKNVDVTNTLETEIGIKKDKSLDKAKKDQFEKLFNNCLRHQENDVKNSNSFIATIELGKISATGGKYTFDDEEFKKLYKEIFLSEKLKNKLKTELGFNNVNVFGNNASSSGFTLDADKLKQINFVEKTANGWNTTGTATLKVIKTQEENIFPYGLKFIFEATTSTEITGENNTKVSLKKGANTEFKIVKDSLGKHKLTRAWNIKELSKQVNLICQETDKTCSLEPNKTINVFKDNGDYIIEAKFTGNIKFEEDQEDYNQGFKFTVDSNIGLTEGTKSKSEGGISQLTSSKMSYQIKRETTPEKWFLVEKTT